MNNRRFSPLSRLVHRFRGLVSFDNSGGVMRRDLGSADESEVQLELDFGRSCRNKGWDLAGVKSLRISSQQ
jgi:hypothetical protein